MPPPTIERTSIRPEWPSRFVLGPPLIADQYKRAARRKEKTNVEHRTSNAQRRMKDSVDRCLTFDVRCSAFGIRHSVFDVRPFPRIKKAARWRVVPVQPGGGGNEACRGGGIATGEPIIVAARSQCAVLLFGLDEHLFQTCHVF
jgi:hypothetical protein